MDDDLHLDDVIQLRKPHPCGGYEWKVVRLGADIGLECLSCHRRILLSRRDLTKRSQKRTLGQNLTDRKKEEKAGALNQK